MFQVRSASDPWISLTDKTHLRDFFYKTKFNNDKDQSGLDGPNSFENINF